MELYKIREIQISDNEQVKALVQAVLTELGVPKVGTAYEDAALNNMYAAYNKPRHAYFVVETEGKVVGAAGIAPLLQADPDICELQKMYFLPAIRGKGAGNAMMQKCLSFAKTQGFSQCYLETMPYMQHAQKLYRRSGFLPISKALGNTGHYNCSVFMLKNL